MAEAMNWNDVAGTKLGDVEPPKMIPAGHYSGLITGKGVVGNTTGKGTLYIEFPIQLTEPMGDVDADEFAASDGFSKNGYKVTFYITPNSLFRFTEFVKGMGGSDDLNVAEGAEYLAECGEPFVATVTHEQSDKNPDRSYMRIDDLVPASAFSG